MGSYEVGKGKEIQRRKGEKERGREGIRQVQCFLRVKILGM